MDLRNEDRKIVMSIVRLLTKHCKLNRHMYIMGLAENAISRFCHTDKTQNMFYAGTMDKQEQGCWTILGLENPQAESYMREHLQGLVEIIERTKQKIVVVYDWMVTTRSFKSSSGSGKLEFPPVLYIYVSI